MKLADILARELESWPVMAQTIAQDESGIIGVSDSTQFRNEDDDGWTTRGLWQMSCKLNGFEMELASDHSTAIITREMWQSARDKLKGETAMPKGNKYGWVRHRGGNRPSTIGVYDKIDVRYRNGEEQYGIGEEQFRWSHNKGNYDIMQWRIHAPEQAISDDAVIDLCVVCADEEMPAAKPIDGPLQWRDRIKEIDREQTAADFDHKAATDARDIERAELVAKLKAEGLALISEPIKAEDSAQGDMVDWRNWKVGDKVELLYTLGDTANEGDLLVVRKVEGITQNQPVRLSPENDSKDGWWPDPEFMKWHSRPSRP